MWLGLPVVFLMVVVPLLDTLTGWQSEARFEKSDFSPGLIRVLHWNTRLYALLYMAAVIWAAVNVRYFSLPEMVALLASLSLLGGIGFAAAHELLHGKETADQVIQRFLTTFLFYPHYKVIHIRSHHIHAGTEHDENTAWLNENIYSYILRTVPGSMIRSWRLEMRRLAASKNASFWQNQMIRLALGQAALLALLLLVAGPGGLGFYLAHTLGSHVVLESVNYIQHYGLLRHKHEEEYEKTGAEHSWDTYHFFSSYITFRVGHHSHHHIAVKPYYLLDVEPRSPKLPVGYFWAIPVVMLPAWWRRVIHARLPSEAPAS